MSQIGSDVPDAIFAHPRLAAIYDDLDPDRSDLDAYLVLVDGFGAESVLDVGCGTGTFACLLAASGKDVTGVDPASASLAVASRKLAGDRVRWIHGTARDLPRLEVDVATMTANVAQVFLTDDDWAANLNAIARAVRPAGHLVFEVRDPARQAWHDWNRTDTWARTEIDGVGIVETWTELRDVTEPLVSFRHTFRFDATGDTLVSGSTLRFRTRSEIEESLIVSGFDVVDVRDAPDRAGNEFVFIARRS